MPLQVKLKYFHQNFVVSKFLLCTPQNVCRLRALLTCGLGLAGSTRPQDCTTAAYLIRLLAQQECIRQCLPQKTPQKTEKKATTSTQELEMGTTPHTEHMEQVVPPGDSGDFLLLQTLVLMLKQQVCTARQSLLHAAATQPLYPTMHCIRYLLRDVQLGYVGLGSVWLEARSVTSAFHVLYQAFAPHWCIWIHISWVWWEPDG